jgi:regulator of sigma E protease
MQSLLFFILALAILVVVHEFGHFWVARRCGVKVLKFSVGFGKPLWKKQGKDGTEYILAAIPLGGFVKMLDEREGEVAPQDLDKTFNRKPLGSRVAIVAAGPIANLLFAVLAYWIIFVVGIPGLRPIIDDIIPESAAAQAQIIKGDEIKLVDGLNTPTWMAVQKAIVRVAESGGIAELTVNSGGVELIRSIVIPKWQFDPSAPTSLITQLGMEPINVALKPIIGSVVAGGAADQAGIKIGDELIAANEVVVDSWSDWVTLIRANPEIALSVNIKRDQNPVSVILKPQRMADNSGKIGAGVDVSFTNIPAELSAELRYSPLTAVSQAVIETWQFSSSTVKSLAGMIKGTVSSKNIGGPISIAQFAGASAERGLLSFISFLAMISISLGILNLLPIPILDGGHLAMYLVEWIKGSPLSEQAQLQGQKVGILLLLMLMFLAFFNDFSRLFGL